MHRLVSGQGRVRRQAPRQLTDDPEAPALPQPEDPEAGRSRWIDAPREEAVGTELGGERHSLRAEPGELGEERAAAVVERLAAVEVRHELVGPQQAGKVGADLERAGSIERGRAEHRRQRSREVRESWREVELVAA